MERNDRHSRPPGRRRASITWPIAITVLIASFIFVLIMFVVPGISDVYLMQSEVSIGDTVSVDVAVTPYHGTTSRSTSPTDRTTEPVRPAAAASPTPSTVGRTTAAAATTASTTRPAASAAATTAPLPTPSLTDERPPETSGRDPGDQDPTEPFQPVILRTAPRTPSSVSAPAAPSEAISSRIRAVVENAAPSVVTFYVSLPARDGFSMQTNQFSGVLLDELGTIATNGYNFQFALTYGGVFYEDAIVQVYLRDDDRTYEVDLLGRDPNTDVALFRLIDPPPLQPITVDTEPALHVGDFVIALGGADLDLAGDGLSVGYITGMKRRSVFQDGAESGMIQTSAFITPLFSGAPLLNQDGRMIGLINSNVSRSYSDILGYALPSGIFAGVVKTIGAADSVVLPRTPWLGLVFMDEDEYADIAAKRAFPPGLFVTEVEGDSAAYTADVRRFDVVTAVDDKKVTSLSALRTLLDARVIGEQIMLTVYRTSTGRYHTLPLYLRERPR